MQSAKGWTFLFLEYNYKEKKERGSKRWGEGEREGEVDEAKGQSGKREMQTERDAVVSSVVP